MICIIYIRKVLFNNILYIITYGKYFELTQKYLAQYGENTILLMQVGSFFEVYALLDKATGIMSGSKIEGFSRICDLNIAEKNSSIGKDAVLMAGFKDIGIHTITTNNIRIFWTKHIVQLRYTTNSI